MNKDEFNGMAESAPNPNLIRFYEKMEALGIDPNDENINLDRLVGDYLEGREPDPKRLLRTPKPEQKPEEDQSQLFQPLPIAV